MLSAWLRTAFKLAVLSLVTGLVMAALGIRPIAVFSAFGEAADDMLRWAVQGLHWAWRYVLLGAVIVVPIWLLL